MERHRESLSAALGLPVEVQGFTDLAVSNLKFSGNAQRRKRNALIFHGTFLLNLDIGLLGQVLRFPSKEPGYRQGRSHADFLTNLRVPADTIKSVLRACWNATVSMETLCGAPNSASARSVVDVGQLLETKYLRDDWNFKF
jgi:lipoate-protein ligase A